MSKKPRPGRSDDRKDRKETPSPKKTPDYNFNKLKAAAKTRTGSDKITPEEIRLNKFLANAGVCSRREADQMIVNGDVKVNGEVIRELGFKVKKTDEPLKPERLVYILLNKPKDFITTTKDEKNRKTVMNLVASACDERIFPVGRLDRNTTGLLLFTNDGDLAERLSHPSGKVKKIYRVELDKPIQEEHYDQIRAGIELEDGLARVDDLAVVSPDAKTLGIEIHIGRNRIVRRIFEHLKYQVEKLDRVFYAGLTKKDLPRGKWRFLTEKEVIQLKFFTGKG